jgi:hypothetical protein
VVHHPLLRAAVIAGVLSCSWHAVAEPITVQYHVTVTQRRYVPIDPVDFIMRMRFDDQPTLVLGNGDKFSHTYFGVPAVAGVPVFPRFPGPPAITRFVGGSTSEIRALVGSGYNGNGGSDHRSGVAQVSTQEERPDGVKTISYMDLSGGRSGHIVGDDPLRATATGLLDLLRQSDFRYQAFASVDGALISADWFTGTATQLDTASVPEPTTVAMLGLGLAGFAATLRRFRS